MKQFIFRLLIFILLYVGVCIIITMLTPYHWGNPWYSTKIQFLEKNKDISPNTFFFGSSRVYRQINPSIFDQEAGFIEKENITSFNLGAPATFNPQSYYLYEQFLESDLSSKVKFCFIELMDVELMEEEVLHQERTTYWQNFSDYSFAVSSIINNKKLTPSVKKDALLDYSISYLEGGLHLGHFGQQIISKNHYNSKYLGTDKNGFFSLEDDFASTKDPVEKANFEFRINWHIINPHVLIQRELSVLETHRISTDYYDGIHLNRILSLIEKSKQKGIQLFFIISPKFPNQSVINISKIISSTNIIDLSDPYKYHEFYTKKYSFDLGHLNSQGANAYSKKLASIFKERIKKCPEMSTIENH